MKKLLILLTTIALIGCNKDADDIDFFKNQLLLNAELVGTWKEMNNNESTRRYYVFSKTFTYTVYVSDENYENREPVGEPSPYRLESGKIHYHPYHYFEFSIKDDILTINHSPGSPEGIIVNYERLVNREDE